MSIEDQILALLGAGPLKAAQIAERLGKDRKTINSLLYRSLRGRVHQDASYRWSLADAIVSRATSGLGKIASRHASLFAYYLDCLSVDAGAEVSVFATSKFDLDYVQLPSLPINPREQADVRWSADPSVAKLLNRQRRDSRTKALWIGWPIFLRKARSRTGWEGAFVEPLLLWPVEADGPAVHVSDDPQINSRALEGLTGDKSSLEEAATLAEELGLDSSDGLDVADLGLRLASIRSGWPWRASPDPESIARDESLSSPSVIQGIHNIAILVLAERQTFTAGLERELRDLQSTDDAQIAKSALGLLLDSSPKSHGDFSKPILEVAPLNAEQREAVRSALTRPLTVITGPPGTGKSQVVTAIIVNAAYHGLKVLFASKNNKAVDVVEERVNGLTSRPVVLRLGPRSLQATLADRLMTVLSAKVTVSQREATTRADHEIAQAGAALNELESRLESVRSLLNDASKIDAQVEHLRSSLGDEVFTQLADFNESVAGDRLKTLAEALRRSERSRQNPLVSLSWFAVRASREKALLTRYEEAKSLLSSLGLPDKGAAAAVNSLPGSIEQASKIAAYHSLRRRLLELPRPDEIAAARASEQKRLGDASVAAFEGWLATLGERLSAEERRDLGDYAALLRSIAAANESGSPVSKAIWARYHQLAVKAAKAFPAWAVTSLSARGRIPFEAGLFDLVVVDEASQCDIASVTPLLFRARRAVVIGDPQQLSHISRLPQARDQGLMVRHGVLQEPGPSWGYRDNSLYALAASRVSADAVIMLRDHHRSHETIIEFSNQEFYDGSLRVATDYGRLKRPQGNVLRWADVPGEVATPADGGAVNDLEAQAVVAELRRLTVDQGYKGTVGVVTPFRAQARRIRELVARDSMLSAVLAARDFLSETAHRYQGDERDTMILSPVVARGLSRGARGFLERTPNLFNVALTRARAAIVVVGDKAECSTCDVEYLQNFVAYVHGLADQTATVAVPTPSMQLDYPPVARPELVSDWERKFYRSLAAAGIFSIPQYPVDQYLLDLALVTEGNRRLDIEIDGEAYHRDPWTGENVRRDQLRDMRLMEMGWDVRRFWVGEIRDDPQTCVRVVSEWLYR